MRNRSGDITSVCPMTTYDGGLSATIIVRQKGKPGYGPSVLLVVTDDDGNEEAVSLTREQCAKFLATFRNSIQYVREQRLPKRR